jgi:hypothetical protein
MKIIAFGHRKRVGKDTAARFINTDFRMKHKSANVQKRGLADKLKAQCHELYSWAGLKTMEYYDDHPEEKEIVLPLLGKTPRQIWIDYGTLVARAVYRYTWVDYLFKSSSPDLLIISDLRFPEEAERSQDLGGQVYRIDNPRIPHTSDLADDPLKDWNGWNGVIVNDGTMETFHSRVIEIASSYLYGTNDTRCTAIQT